MAILSCFIFIFYFLIFKFYLDFDPAALVITASAELCLTLKEHGA